MASEDVGQDRSAAPRSGRRPPGPATIAVLLLVVAVIVLALAAWNLIGAAGHLLGGRSELNAAQRAFEQADLGAADGHLGAARERFGSAADQLRHVTVRPLAAAPVLGRELRGIQALAEGGRDVAAAGAHLSGAVLALPGGMSSLLPSEGRFPVEMIEQLEEPASRAAQLVGDAEARVRATPPAGLSDTVSDAYVEFLGQVGEVGRLTRTAAGVTRVLPGFLGGEGTRSYLLLAQNPAELRGAGGFPGAYAVATIDDGRIEFGEFASIWRLPTLPAEEAPAPSEDFRQRYDRHGGAGFWPNITMTPDFPTAGAAMVDLYAETVGEDLDGVIGVDPAALAALVQLTGPIEIPVIGDVAADEVVEVFANEAYDALGTDEERKALLGVIAATSFQDFMAGIDPGDVRSALGALAEAASGKRLMLYSAHPDEQAQLAAQPIAGAMAPAPAGTDYLAVIANNSAGNKADYYTRRSLRYVVQLQPDGSAVADLTVTLTNETPASGLPSHVIGPNADDLEAGDNRSLLAVYCARDCEVEGFSRSLGEEGFGQQTELDRTVLTTRTLLPSGAEEELLFRWRVADAWVAEEDGGRYRLAIQGQPTVQPTDIEVAVLPPEGLAVVTEDGAGPGPAGYTGVLEGDLSLDVMLVRQEE